MSGWPCTFYQYLILTIYTALILVVICGIIAQLVNGSEGLDMFDLEALGLISIFTVEAYWLKAYNCVDYIVKIKEI